jgi:hypothetical protein
MFYCKSLVISKAEHSAIHRETCQLSRHRDRRPAGPRQRRPQARGPAPWVPPASSRSTRTRPHPRAATRSRPGEACSASTGIRSNTVHEQIQSHKPRSHIAERMQPNTDPIALVRPLHSYTAAKRQLKPHAQQRDAQLTFRCACSPIYHVTAPSCLVASHKSKSDVSTTRKTDVAEFISLNRTAHQ